MCVITDGDRDLPVHSEDQAGVTTRIDGGLQIRYDGLRSADGGLLPVSMVVTIMATAAGLEFSAAIRGREGLRVREVALPIVELDRTTAEPGEAIYRAEGLGRRIQDPRSALYRAHTEYMNDDGAGVWEDVAYPGELSMPWHGLSSARGFLYLGQHDPAFTSVLMSSGVPPRGSEGELWLSAVTPSGQTEVDVPPRVVALVEDWRAAAAMYREWADTWYTGPHPGVRPLQGWQRIIMRHQYGQVLFRYEDLVDVFEAGRELGLDGVLLFGWWKAGFDRGYPNYEPDDELGGADALREAIAEIRRRGGFVALYANGNLVDRLTSFAKEYGAEVSKKDLAGNDYVVPYAFARESRTLRHFAANSFVVACHGSARWRDTMARVARIHASLGTDAVFFDQTAFHLAAWPCLDTSHDHGMNSAIEAQYRRKTLAGIRAAASATSLGSEGMSDCMIPSLNYHHGWGFAFHDEPEAFPALFRSVFPEPAASNRLVHDEHGAWQDQLNYAFAYNLLFDVALHRSRLQASAYPDYAAYIAELTALRRTYARAFEQGEFIYVDDEPLTHVVYRTDDNNLHVYWNPSDKDLDVDGVTIPQHRVAVAAKEGWDS
jgi:hypothetical protein